MTTLVDEKQQKLQQYSELQKTQTQKFKEQEALRKGLTSKTTQGNDDLNALEQMDLDRKDDDKMVEQFNLGTNKSTGLSLKAQTNVMKKENTVGHKFWNVEEQKAMAINEKAQIEEGLDDLEEIQESKPEPEVKAVLQDTTL